MTPRGAERPDDDADLRDEQAGRSRRRFGRGPTDFEDVPEEETGWLDDLRTAKQARGAIGPGEPEPPARGRHTSDEFPTIGRHGTGEQSAPGRRRAPEDAPTGRRAAAEDVPTGRRAAPGDVPTGRRAAVEDGPTGRRAAPEDAPSGRRAAPEPATGRHGTAEIPMTGRRRAPEDAPTGRRAAPDDTATGRPAPEDAPTGRRAVRDDTATGRRSAPEDAPTGRRAVPDSPTGRGVSDSDSQAGRRAASDDTAGARHGGSESTGRHGQVGGREPGGETGRRGADRDLKGGGSGRPVSPVPGGSGFGSRNVNPARPRPEAPAGRARPDVTGGIPRPDAALESGRARPGSGRARPESGSARPESGAGDSGPARPETPRPESGRARPATPRPRPDGNRQSDTGRHGVPETASSGTIPVVPGPAGVRTPAVPGRAGAMAASQSGAVRRPESHVAVVGGHQGHPGPGVEHPADAASSVIHPGAALGSVSPEPVRQGPRSPQDNQDRPRPGVPTDRDRPRPGPQADPDRPRQGPPTGRVTATATALVGAPPTGRVSGAASVAGIVAAPRPPGVDAPVSPGVGRSPRPPGADAPQSPAVGIPPARPGDGPPRPGDGPMRPATGAARVTAAASVPIGTASVPGAAAVAHARNEDARNEKDEDDGQRQGLREQMRAQRKLRVVALLTLAGVALLVLPLIFGIMSVVRDPVFKSLDALSVPTWAAQQVDDRGSGSRWCFMDCRFRERTAQSQRTFAQTNQAYTAALRQAGWQPWKVSGCPDQPIAASDGVYTCWRRDEFTLDLWVKLPDCAVDKIAAQDPSLLQSNPPNGGASPKQGKCTGSTVSIKVQNAITDQRGTPDGEQPGLTGETPDPVLSNDPLLEPTPSSS